MKTKQHLRFHTSTNRNLRQTTVSDSKNKKKQKENEEHHNFLNASSFLALRFTIAANSFMNFARQATERRDHVSTPYHTIDTCHAQLLPTLILDIGNFTSSENHINS